MTIGQLIDEHAALCDYRGEPSQAWLARMEEYDRERKRKGDAAERALRRAFPPRDPERLIEVLREIAERNKGRVERGEMFAP